MKRLREWIRRALKAWEAWQQRGSERQQERRRSRWIETGG